MWKNTWSAVSSPMSFSGWRPIEWLIVENMNRLRIYASFVRFSHSVFALPFAFTGALLALHRLGEWTGTSVLHRVGWIVVAMVAARSAAMGFNRLADASHDALNPRTAMRELPRGVMTRAEARAFVTVSSIAFDRAHGLRSIPVHFGVARSLVISRAMHLITVVCLAALGPVAHLGGVYLAGVAGVAALLVYEQSLINEHDLSQVKRAFDLNGYVGILYLATTAAAIYVH